jgi:hypothetical protein
MPNKTAAPRARLAADSAGSTVKEFLNTDGEPQTRLTRRLFRDAEDLVWMHLYLPFMRGLAHGSLPR